MFFPQHPAVPFQHPLLEHARAAKIVLRPERRGEVTHARERVRVFLPQHPAARFQHPLLERTRAGMIALRPERRGIGRATVSAGRIMASWIELWS